MRITTFSLSVPKLFASSPSCKRNSIDTRTLRFYCSKDQTVQAERRLPSNFVSGITDTNVGFAKDRSDIRCSA
jgi:hypothetical protein